MSVRRSCDLHQITALLEHLNNRFELAGGERAYPNRSEGDHAMTPTMIDLICGAGGSSSGAGMTLAPGYVVLANTREQIRQLGKAVTPPAARDLIAAVAESLGHDLSNLGHGPSPEAAA